MIEEYQPEEEEEEERWFFFFVFLSYQDFIENAEDRTDAMAQPQDR